MPKYQGAPAAPRDGSGPVGILLVNSGTPDSARVRDIRRFLGNLLGDPRVVELPRWLWLPILHGLILPLRPLRSARKYREMHAAGRSPLRALSDALRSALEQELTRQSGATALVATGMLYSSPAVRDAILGLVERGARRLLVVPLFPQYCGVTTGAVVDAVGEVLGGLRWVPEVRYVTDYHDHEDHIEALRATVAAHWATHGRTGHLLMSWHGVPSAYCDKGDPYHGRCHATAQLLADALGLREGEWSVAFQSRFGGGQWLRPYTAGVLESLPSRGVHTATVVCPGFAIDCLETLQEIEVENRARFLRAGGTKLDYVPALNARPEHVQALTRLIGTHTRGWAERAGARPSGSFPRVVSLN